MIIGRTFKDMVLVEISVIIHFDLFFFREATSRLQWGLRTEVGVKSKGVTNVFKEVNRTQRGE